jgi:hypothetical protein
MYILCIAQIKIAHCKTYEFEQTWARCENQFSPHLIVVRGGIIKVHMVEVFPVFWKNPKCKQFLLNFRRCHCPILVNANGQIKSEWILQKSNWKIWRISALASKTRSNQRKVLIFFFLKYESVYTFLIDLLWQKSFKSFSCYIGLIDDLINSFQLNLTFME